MNPFNRKKQKRIKTANLVHGYEPCGDTHVYEKIWHLIEFEDGTRDTDVDLCGIHTMMDSIDFSIPSRVKIWKRGQPIAKSLLMNLHKLDCELEKVIKT